MKATFRMLSCLFVAILLSACGPGRVPKESDEDKLIQVLQYGEFNQSVLSQLPWDSGRCEITSNYAMAETKTGYYLVHDQYLWYADKENLSNWVPVCNRPECTHKKGADCSANIRSDSIAIKDDRIFYLQSTRHNNLYPGLAIGVVLASMALDGTDQRVEYVLEEAISTQEGGTQNLLTPDYWLCQTCYIDAQGNEVIRVFQIADGKKIEYPTKPNAGNTNSQFIWMRDFLQAYGEMYFSCIPMGTDKNLLSGDAFLIRDGELVRQDMSMIVQDTEYTGMYLWGDTLRLFRRNRGYYDRNLATGEEVKLESYNMRNSNSFLVLPNCIIETTLHNSTIPFRKDNARHRMTLFDGQKWKTVELPYNLQKASVSGYVEVVGVTSDSILLRYRDYAADSGNVELYRILLDTSHPTVQYMATIQNPQFG